MSTESSELAPAGAEPARTTGRPQRGRITAVIACSAALIPLAAACSSAHPTATAASTRKTCAQVTAVLSDGPDPGDDQVGYAEAQILPLRQVHGSTPALRSAIADLADAYAKFFASNGKSAAATRAVASAAAHMNKLCPGAGAAA